MAGPLPHTKDIRQMMEDYLEDSQGIVSQSFAVARRSPGFMAIYKTSLATDAVLSKLATSRMRPGLASLRSIDLRIPFVVAMRQTSVASLELRRFLELCCWTMYFTDHPVEWSHFVSHPKQAYQNSLEWPISYCARRGLSFYSRYVLELMKAEPSGVGLTAIGRLRQLLEELNAVVHPGTLACSKGKNPPIDDVSEKELRAFGKTQKAVFANACILLAAFNRRRFDKMTPMHRAFFDWLVGPKTSKTIRSGEFGLVMGR